MVSKSDERDEICSHLKKEKKKLQLLICLQRLFCFLLLKMSTKDEVLVKVLLTGPSGAGKTQLLRRLCGEPYDPAQAGSAPPTGELASFGVLPPCEADGRRVRVQVWDLCFRTAADPYRTLPPGCALAAVALAFDATSERSYGAVRDFYTDVCARWPRLPLVLVACRCDGARVADRALLVDTVRVLRQGRAPDAPPLWWAETSAADGRGVARLAADLARAAVGCRTGLGVPDDAPDEWHTADAHKHSGCCVLL